PVATLMNVLFPDPFGPIRPRISPLESSRLTFSSAFSERKCFDSPSARKVPRPGPGFDVDVMQPRRRWGIRARRCRTGARLAESLFALTFQIFHQIGGLWQICRADPADKGRHAILELDHGRILIRLMSAGCIRPGQLAGQEIEFM